MNKSLFLIVMFLLASFGCVYAVTWTTSCAGPNFPYSALLPSPTTQLYNDPPPYCNINNQLFTQVFLIGIFTPTKILQGCGFTFSCTDYHSQVGAMSESTSAGYCCFNGTCPAQGTADADDDDYFDPCDQNDSDQCTAINPNDICQDTSTGSIGIGSKCMSADDIKSHCKQMQGAGATPTYRSICTKPTQHASKVASNDTEMYQCTKMATTTAQWALCPAGQCPNCTAVKDIGNVVSYGYERNLCDFKQNSV